VNVVVDGIIYELQSHGGISRLFSEILPRMCQADETLNITLLMSGQSQQTLPRHPHIHIRSTPRIERFLQPRRVWRYPIRMLKEWWLRLYIERTEDKIWHSTYFTMPKMWRGAIVVTVHDMAHELYPDLFKTIGAKRFREQKRRCVLSADAVICVSENTKRDLQRFYGVGSDKIWVVPNGYSDTFSRLTSVTKKMEAPISSPFLLYVGSRSHYKNFGHLIQAYSVWHHRREVNLVAVGQEWSSDEMEMLTRLGIYDRVCLLDKVDDEALCYLYNTAVALVYPSLYEGFGIPLLEAMACGCPIVASRIPATVEVAGDCPVYFDPREVEDLVLALDKVLSEGRDSPRSLAGLERVKNFSWQRTAEQTLEVYRSLGNL